MQWMKVTLADSTRYSLLQSDYIIMLLDVVHVNHLCSIMSLATRNFLLKCLQMIFLII